ncbi:DUF4363 family protein [Cytobacillus gottheilii]|uniref:DUF4363 family protein n=1 Tax=Cytobacillus gottheilii TaxID=859144 RepID=UPI0009BBA36E|nr:DUF4363 family protein [Cytobacillus gottheilii]
MKRFMLYKLIPVIILLLFIAIMQSGIPLKQPFTKKEDILFYMDRIEKHILSEQWEVASGDLHKLEQAYSVIKKRIQFSVERDELDSFTTAIKKASGYIHAHEQGGALAELNEARYLWEGLGK